MANLVIFFLNKYKNIHFNWLERETKFTIKVEACFPCETGRPITAPAYDPQKAIVASLDLSSGGAQYLQMPWQAG